MNDKPTTQLNLDTLEREDKREPFAFVLGGERFVCKDPQELDYRTFDETDPDFEDQFKILLDNDTKFQKFKSQKLPLWKMRKLSEAMLEHYGLGNTAASSTS